jgi:hypothetical protein
MIRKEVQALIANHPTCQTIHDQLVTTSLDLGEAFDKAIVCIYELDAELEELRKRISAGYVRADTTHIKWKSKTTPQPVDGGDDWIATGVSHE